MALKRVSEEIVRGDGRDYEIGVKDRDRAVVDITGAKIWFTLKESYDDLDVNAAVQLTTDNAAEISITDATNGLAVIYIKNTHTSGLSIRSYFMDVQIKEVDRELRTIVYGTMAVIPDVTLSIV